MQEIKIIIENLKKIKKLEFVLNLEKGIYAIIGNNGSGKSSLITSIAKLVRPSILKEEFAGNTNNYKNTKITYINPYGLDIIWQKNPNWNAIQNYKLMPRYKGFFESSILTGTRFFHLDNKKITFTNKDIENSIEATPFIKNNLDYIINGTKTSHFDNLFYIRINNKNRIYYLQFNQDNYITEFNLSTGEYFLLSVLKIIQTFSKRRKQDDLRLLIIDEIDIALHPLAEKRFIEKLKEWMNEFNLLIIFATHSLQIINSLKAEEIYYLENDKIFNPIYPAYLTSKLFQHTSYDRIILVEDELAIRFINKILDSFNLERILYKIIPIGGWEKVLEIYELNEKFKYFGNAYTLNILDRDIIGKANKGKFKRIKKTFLPFNNVERFSVEKLFSCNNFKESIETIIYPKKIVELNITELTDDEFNINNAKTDTIKKIFKKLIEEIAIYSEKENIDVINFIINYIYDEIKDTSVEFKSLKLELKDFL